MKKYKIGYTQGVFDMFHIGHLNLLNHAKEYCETLVVGVNSDRLVQEYKQKTTVINENARKIIVENIKAVDYAIIAETLDKEYFLEKIKFDVIFIGDDWKNSERWNMTQKILNSKGVEVIYLPHTPNISSTILRACEKDAMKE